MDSQADFFEEVKPTEWALVSRGMKMDEGRIPPIASYDARRHPWDQGRCSRCRCTCDLAVLGFEGLPMLWLRFGGKKNVLSPSAEGILPPKRGANRIH